MPRQKEAPKDCVCERCGKEYVYVRSNGSSGKHCASCQTTLRRQAMKAKAVEYKGGKCCKCGYDKTIIALEFHHLDPSEKELSISCNKNPSWDKLKLELDKCILVCANCHREIHFGSVD